MTLSTNTGKAFLFYSDKMVKLINIALLISKTAKVVILEREFSECVPARWRDTSVGNRKRNFRDVAQPG